MIQEEPTKSPVFKDGSQMIVILMPDIRIKHGPTLKNFLQIRKITWKNMYVHLNTEILLDNI